MVNSRFKIGTFLNRDEIAYLNQLSNVKGIQAVFVTWALILGAMAAVAYFPSIWTVILALIILGGRQLGLAILMHDAAHYSLFKTRKLNQWVGTWLCALPIGHDLKRYREHHLRHHQYAGSQKDPDLDLVGAFPTSRASLQRKFLRDLSGITGLKRLYGTVLMDFGIIQYTVSGRVERINQSQKSKISTLKSGIHRISGKILLQLIFFGALFYFGKPWLYGLWVISYLTTFSLFIRIRSIAEHACTLQNLDPLKNTRTTYANVLARLTVAPHRVNFHLEHHLLMNVPSFNLPNLHRLLVERGALKSAFLAKNYFEVLKTASTGMAFVIISIFVFQGCSSSLQLPGSLASPTPTPSVTTYNTYLYVANQTTNNISAYTLNSTTGALTQLTTGSPFASGNLPIALAASPNGQFLYAANFTDGTVSAYTIARNTGILTPITGSPFTAGTNPSAIVIDSSSSFALVANQGSNNVSVFTINVGTGALTAATGSPFATVGTKPEGIAIDRHTKFVYTANNTSNNIDMFTIDSSTGVLAHITGNTIAAGAGPVPIVVDTSGKFVYAGNTGAGGISGYVIVTSTGVLAPLSNSPFGATSPVSLATEASEKFLYSITGTSVSAFTVDILLGNLTAITGSPFSTTGVGTGSIIVDPTTSFLYATNSTPGNISGMTIGTSGSLAASTVSSFPVSAGTAPVGMAIVKVAQ